MRIALVGPYPVDTDRFDGGVETSFFNLVEGLSSFDDVEPHVITFVRGATETTRRMHGQVPVLYLAAPARFNNLTFYRNDRKALRAAIDELAPDLVHAQDAIAYGYVSLRAVTRAPVALSIHGVVREELKFMTRPTDRLRTSIARVPLQRYCVRHARYLLQPSRYPEEYFGSLVHGQIFDVGNPIGERFFGAEPSPEAGTLLYAGGVTPGKRVLDLVEMLALVRRQVPGARLRIAGHTANAEYVSAVRDRARELGLEEDVLLLGALSPAELLEEYRRASIFVLASGQENSPMVIAEAMAVGVPVVATRVGGVHSLVDHGTSGFLFEVGDLAELARRVSGLLLDDGERSAFGAAARAIAESRFRSAQVAARVRDVYRKMISDLQ